MTGDTPIRTRLEALIAEGGLRGSAAAAGKDLLTRLDAPARVVLFGLPGSGKMRLFNALAGKQVLPPGVPLPTTILRRGDSLRASVVLSDGHERHWDGHPLAEIAALAPALVTLEAPLPALRDLTLMRLAAEASIEEQTAAIAWAARQCDIAIWCSQDFDEIDQQVWSLAPERLKDNAYLAEIGAGPVQDDFVASFDISDNAEALSAELASCVARGRHALLDHALLFLSRYAPEKVDPARPPVPKSALKRDTALLAPAKTESRPLTRPRSEAPVSRPLSRPLSRPGLRAVPPSSESGPIPIRRAQRQVPAPGVSNICGDAAALLRERARDLSRLLPTYGKKPAAHVFGHCLETMEVLAQKISEAGQPELADLVLDVIDAITLLQGEGGNARAADSVTLLLQLRRDLEARQAA